MAGGNPDPISFEQLKRLDDHLFCEAYETISKLRCAVRLIIQDRQ